MRRPSALLLAALLAAFVTAPAAAFDLQGHRGARGLAPENTLAAFDTALSLGVDTLELDTVLTRDGTVVISHDATLNVNLTRDAAGRWIDAPGAAIRTLTLAELQRHDVGRIKPGTRYAETYPEQRGLDGERIPTLAQLFERVAQRVRFNIETKLSPLAPELTPAPEEFARAVLAVVDAHAMRSRVTLQSFDWRSLKAARRLAPDVPTACLSAQQRWLDNIADPRWTDGATLAEAGSLPKLVKAAGCSTWSPYFGDLNEASLAEARGLGLKVVVWTVNDAAAIERMLALGVDGIISDRPDRVRSAMAARGMALPPAAPTKP
jgi:glycerophosphoryl diester phosphodiesterase